ncbi:MAG: ABC transporter substrate-binding protein [Nitrolancea sp.]
MDEQRISGIIQRIATGDVSRRTFLKRLSAIGVGVPVVSALLAACGGSNNSTPTLAATSGSSSGGSSPTPTTAITVNQNASPSAAASSAATTAASGKSGGTVTFTRSIDSTSCDPTLWHNPDIWPFLNVYQPLVSVDDKGLEITPSIAEKWDVAADGLTYTFHIRSGVKFGDGSDMTVDDIKWTLERAKADERGGWNFTLMQAKDISAPDSSTIVITLTGAWAPFLSDISMFNSSIISKAFFDKNGGDDYLASHCMGTGPFVLKEWKKAESVTLTKNQYYWESGLPYLDEIVLKQVPDTNSQILQLQGGETHGIIGQNDVPFNRVPDLEKDPKLQVMKFTSTYNNFVVLNCRNAPLDDPMLRQALNYATDKDSLIQTLLFGNAEVSNSFMPNGMLFWNPDQEPYTFDLDKAKEVLAKSKSPDGAKISMVVSSGNEQQSQIATALKSMWTKINVELEIQQMDSAVSRDNYLHNQFETNLSGWTNDIIDPDELVSYAILPESNENYHTGWTNQQAIDLAHQAQTELDPDKRRQLYYQVQQIHKDDAPFVYLYVIPYVDVLASAVQGYFHHPMGQYVFKNTYLES